MLILAKCPHISSYGCNAMILFLLYRVGGPTRHGRFRAPRDRTKEREVSRTHVTMQNGT